MLFPLIRSFSSFTVPGAHSFFILSKGNNAGRPGLRPWPNSFIVTCHNEDTYNFYFWLTHAAFLSGKFKLRLRGSVIPFIIVHDVRDLLRSLAPAIRNDWKHFQDVLGSMEKLSGLKSSSLQQVKTSEDLQKALVQHYFQGY